MGAFESWFLHRVAHAVAAGEVSADLLTELKAEMEAARDLSQEEGHALAVRNNAERRGIGQASPPGLRPKGRCTS